MSTDLSIRFYFRDASSVERFEALVHAIDESPLASHTWSDFGVALRQPLQYRTRQSGTLTSEQICAAARSAGLGGDESMGTQTSLRCWRRDGGQMVESSIVASLDVWGDEYGRAHEEDLRMGGNAAITLSHVGPYVIDVSGRDVVYNEKVEANLEDLTSLMIHLTNTLQPDLLRLFDDDGLYLPCNAHAVYFRRPELVLEEVGLLRRVWQEGLPAHRVAPLRTYTGGPQDGALHLGRTPEQRRALWERLSAGLAHTPTVDDVSATLATGRFDTLTKGETFFVLEYPHYVNAFVARFYMEVLECAGARAGVVV